MKYRIKAQMGYDLAIRYYPQYKKFGIWNAMKSNFLGTSLVEHFYTEEGALEHIKNHKKHMEERKLKKVRNKKKERIIDV